MHLKLLEMVEVRLDRLEVRLDRLEVEFEKFEEQQTTLRIWLAISLVALFFSFLMYAIK